MLRFIKTRQRQRQLAQLAPCPLPQPLPLAQAQRVLVFAPHPDDEALGCGGTLAQLAARCAVKVVLVTDGSGAGGLPAGSDVIRQAEFRQALALLGIHDSAMLGAPDGHFTPTASLTQQVTQLLATYQPDWVFLPSPLDYHRDHARIADWLTPLCWRTPSVQQLLFYEIWSPVPATHVVDITEVMAQKQTALAAHVTAMACGDYLRAIEGLNRYRGLYLGRERWAEAFWVETRAAPRLFDAVQALSLRLLARLG